MNGITNVPQKAGQSIGVDTSLTQAGAAADAKATGDALKNKADKDELAALMSAKANKSTEHTVTLPASGWTGAAAPYTITVDVPGVTATNDVSVFPQYAWTPEQAEAWAGAMVLSGDQAAGKLTLKAYGDKPVVDLAVTVLVGDEIKKGG